MEGKGGTHSDRRRRRLGHGRDVRALERVGAGAARARGRGGRRPALARGLLLERLGRELLLLELGERLEALAGRRRSGGSGGGSGEGGREGEGASYVSKGALGQLRAHASQGTHASILRLSAAAYLPSSCLLFSAMSSRDVGCEGAEAAASAAALSFGAEDDEAAELKRVAREAAGEKTRCWRGSTRSDRRSIGQETDGSERAGLRGRQEGQGLVRMQGRRSSGRALSRFGRPLSPARWSGRPPRP